MINRDEQRYVGLTFNTNQLLDLLVRHGYLSKRLCGPDVGVVAVAPDPRVPEHLTFVLEGDSLDPSYAWRGHLKSSIVDLSELHGRPAHGDEPADSQ